MYILNAQTLGTILYGLNEISSKPIWKKFMSIFFFSSNQICILLSFFFFCPLITTWHISILRKMKNLKLRSKHQNKKWNDGSHEDHQLHLRPWPWGGQWIWLGVASEPPQATGRRPPGHGVAHRPPPSPWGGMLGHHLRQFFLGNSASKLVSNVSKFVFWFKTKT